MLDQVFRKITPLREAFISSGCEILLVLTGADPAILGNIKLRAAARNFTGNNRVYAQLTFGKGIVSAIDAKANKVKQRI